MWIKDLKYEIKWKFQRFKRGYSDNDVFSIHDWFEKIFPKMVNELAHKTNGHPCNSEELQKEVKNFPLIWVIEQIPKINKILKKYGEVFTFDDDMCNWLLILLRIRDCVEKLDDFNPDYGGYWDNKDYIGMDKELENNKKEAFYLMEKWFYDLWW